MKIIVIKYTYAYGEHKGTQIHISENMESSAIVYIPQNIYDEFEKKHCEWYTNICREDWKKLLRGKGEFLVKLNIKEII